MSAYDEHEKELYAEAMRTVPGILAARQRHEREHVIILLNSYFQAAGVRKLAKDRAWSIMFAAMTYQMSEMVKEIAFHREETEDSTTSRMGVTAASWVAETRGVSGY